VRLAALPSCALVLALVAPLIPHLLGFVVVVVAAISVLAAIVLLVASFGALD
jgi:hypothetical protein